MGDPTDIVQLGSGATQRCLNLGFSERIGNSRRTGWEITLKLVRKLATLHEETCDPDAADWYRRKFEKDASYSDLLDELAKTPAERQQLLRGYWEPNDREREEGEK